MIISLLKFHLLHIFLHLLYFHILKFPINAQKQSKIKSFLDQSTSI